MSEKSNIDRLFQEKFKDFEAIPSDKVWERIQTRMNVKEKKTTLLPFWLRLCSFAAVFLIGFSVATTFIAGPFGLKNPFITTEEKNASSEKTTVSDKDSKQNTTIVSDSFENINKESNAVVSNTDTVGNTVVNSENSTAEKNSSEKTAVTNSAKRKYSKANLNTTVGNSKSESKNETVLHKDKTKVTSATAKNAIVLNTDNSKEKDTQAIAQKNSQTVPSEKSNSVTDKNNVSVKNNTVKSGNVLTTGADSSAKSNTIVSDNTQNSTEKQHKEDTSAENKNSRNNNSDSDHLFNNTNAKVAYESGNRHIPAKKETVSNVFDLNSGKSGNENSKTDTNKENLVADNNSLKKAIEKGVSTVTDSLASNKEKVAEKETEKKVDEEKEAKDKKEKGSKWVVSSSFSPVYMNLNGSGSALDSKFAENSKSYQTSMSYGVGLKYALNNKWTVRTGVNVLNFEYNTNNINYYYSSHGAGLEHVNENGTGSAIVVSNPDPKGIAYDDDGMVTTRYKGNINHRINYMEVPLELSYKILNKKFGIDVIGGVSTMFLNDNKVSLVSAESSMNIGEANNLNKIHFSTNVGLGLRYNVIKSLQVNVEPMFKYQINTYNGDSGNFKPYFMGVYSGISYKF